VDLVGDAAMNSAARVEHMEIDFDLDQGTIGDIDVILHHNNFQEVVFDGSLDRDRMTRDGQVSYNANFIRQHFDSREQKVKFANLISKHKAGGRWQLQVIDKGPEDESKLLSVKVVIQYAE
jgi:subtilisin-like proprotein convertase family protein